MTSSDTDARNGPFLAPMRPRNENETSAAHRSVCARELPLIGHPGPMACDIPPAVRNKALAAGAGAGGALRNEITVLRLADGDGCVRLLPR